VYALDEPVDSPANVGPAFIEQAQSQATESSPASSVGSLGTHQGIEMKADSQVPPRRKRGGWGCRWPHSRPPPAFAHASCGWSTSRCAFCCDSPSGHPWGEVDVDLI